MKHAFECRCNGTKTDRACLLLNATAVPPRQPKVQRPVNPLFGERPAYMVPAVDAETLIQWQEWYRR